MVILVLVGHLLTSLSVFILELPVFSWSKGPRGGSNFLPCVCTAWTTSSPDWVSWYQFEVFAKKLKAQQSLPVPQTQPRNMHKGKGHRPLTKYLSNSRKSTSKEQQMMFATEILQNQQRYSNKQPKQSIWIHTFWKLTAHFMFSNTPFRL